MAKSGIYRLHPVALTKPWGGGHLDALCENTQRDKIGEYIVFSDLPKFPVSIEVENQQVPLAEFLQSQAALSATSFMVKILSTQEPISLQNHPSDDDAKALGLSGNGKFECWSILDADSGARAYLGLKPELDKTLLNTLHAAQNPLEFFNEHEPKRGDVIKLRPGLIHSTLGRLLFYEIQQNSDHTFRIYDFGRGRELHTDWAMRSMHDQTPDIATTESDLVTDKFSVIYHRVESSLQFKRRDSKFSVLTYFGSRAELHAQGQKFDLQWGDSFLATTEEECKIIKSGELDNDARYVKLPMVDMLFEAFA